MAPARAFITFVILIMLLDGCRASQSSPTGDVPAARRASHRYDFTAIHMGVKARVALYAADEATAADHAAACFDRLAALDAIMSDYRADSELMRLCELAGSAPVPVSEDLFNVLCMAADIWRASDGAFDVTIGPVVRLWRAARTDARRPDGRAINNAMRRVGMQHVHLYATDQAVRLAQPCVQLDLGGIGKGYALDQLAHLLESRGVTQYMLDLGGDLRLGDQSPGVDGWRIMLPSVVGASDTDEHRDIVRLANVGIATSGDAEQYAIIDDQRYSHIIDPRTGRALTTPIEVTVIAPSAALADGLASAVSVLGPDRGLTLIERIDNTACRIIVAVPDGPTRVHTSRNWPRPDPPAGR